MKKKIGFLLSTCMSITALPLFAAACKSEQPNPGKQEEIDLNSLFKISLPQNTKKKPSELKPEDIDVKILNKDIKVEIQKVEFKEGKGVLVSYLATNLKTNKIVDEKTITLEVATKKDVEPKTEKNYADLITISVKENAKQKTADKVTKDDIKLEIAQGESFKAEVISVNVQENSKTAINVKIKITDNETTKELTKTLEGFAQELPEKNYDSLITISVDESTKLKTADKVTIDDIKLEIASGEKFDAEVTSVSVQKNNRTVINVKIKVTDNETTKELTKTLEGFAQALPEKILKGYEDFKDIVVVNDDKAYDWLKNAADGTKIYYNFREQKFFTGLKQKDKPENPEIFAILETKEDPGWGIETATPDAKQDDNSFKGTALLVKQDGKVGIKFRISQWNNNTKKATYFDEVATSNLISIDRITKNDLNKIAGEVVFDYPDKVSVLVNDVEQAKITNNIKENYTIEITRIQKVLEQNKLVVNYKVKYSKEGREVESDIQTKEISGFKVDDFSSMFAGLEFTVESKETKLPSQVKEEEIKAVDSDLKVFMFADGITKEVKIKENSADDHRGLLTVIFKATRNSDKSVFEKEYNIDGLKISDIDLDQVIEKFGELSIKEGIDKSNTFASTISIDDLKFGTYDPELISLNLISISVPEGDSTKIIVNLEFSNRLKSNTTKTKEFQIDGFKPFVKNDKRNEYLDAYAQRGNLFVFSGNDEQKLELLNYLQSNEAGLKKMLRIDDSIVKGVDSEYYGGKPIGYISLNKSLILKNVKVNTNGSKEKRNIGFNSKSNLGVKIELQDKNVILRFRLDTIKSGKNKFIDSKGEVFTQVLFTIQ